MIEDPLILTFSHKGRRDFVALNQTQFAIIEMLVTRYVRKRM